jgi:hypothetical protein
MLQRRAQSPMVFVLERHEAERLQNSVERLPHGAQDFSHAMHRPGLCLERDLDKIALDERLRQAQQAASSGDGLKFCFGAAAVFEPDRSQDRIAKLDPGSTPRGVRLGEVGHIPTALWHHPLLRNRLLTPIVQIPCWQPELTICTSQYLKSLAHVDWMVNVR